MGESNLFKLKYRDIIQKIIRAIILSPVRSSQLVANIKKLVKTYQLSESESKQLFQIIEIEIINLHEYNISRYKIRPSEFENWKQKMDH